MTLEAAALQRTRAVFFDWYGTLVPLAALEAACSHMARGRGAELAARWRERQLEASWLRTIMGRWADFDTITADALEIALAEIGTHPGADANPAQRSELVRTFLELPVRDDAAQALDELRRDGLVVGVLSNGSRRTLERGVRAGGLAVDHVLSADDARAFKPHPSLYQLAAGATALPPAEIGFVTANAWDAAGATAFGFDVLWLRADSLSQLPAVGSPQPNIGSWDDVVPRFTEPARYPHVS